MPTFVRVPEVSEEHLQTMDNQIPEKSKTRTFTAC